MSAIGGIYNFDGAPIDGELLISLGNELGTRNPDGGRNLSFNSIGMTHRAFHTTRDSQNELQPHVSRRRQLLAWDGRLDNRSDLIRALGDELIECQTDVPVVMAAYLKWGDEFLSRIVGDFAFSFWDPQSRRLLLARDPIGPRTLYYYRNKQTLIWSTALRPLISLIDAHSGINEEYIADYLSRLPDPSDTPYRNVHAVPPGCVVIAGEGNLKIHRFWKPIVEPRIRYRTDGQYEEHFRQLFDEAVRCRLNVEGAICAELSGGLDSSAVVCMADHLIKRYDSRVSKLETISLVFDEASRADEREFITAVEEQIGKSGRHIREDDYRILEPVAIEQTPIIPNPIANFARYQNALNQTMREAGARVLLSGKGGDEILTSMRDPSPELCDLMVRGRLNTLHQRLAVWSETLNKNYSALFWTKAVLPLLPRNAQLFFGGGTKSQIVQVIDRNFATRMNLAERLLGRGYPLRIFDRSVQIARLTGSNRAYIEKEIPHLEKLMAADPQ
ncbi:MAG: asparagine synthase-related protein, partial [Pyrinomonadaceae bacterium]